MRIFSSNRGAKGSRTAQKYAIRFAYVITEEAKRRATILTFWQNHGLAATIDAYKIQRRTLFIWKRKLKEGKGRLESLNTGSRAPKIRRKRLWSAAVVEEVKRIRFDHPNLGKEKLHPLLLAFCKRKRLQCPEERAIGQLIKDLGGLGVMPLRITGTGRIKPLKRQKSERKPHGFKARYSRPLCCLRHLRRTYQRVKKVRHNLHRSLHPLRICPRDHLPCIACSI